MQQLSAHSPLRAAPTAAVLCAAAVAAAAAVMAWVAVRRALLTPLRRIPGPALSSFTNVPMHYHIARGKFHDYLERLHAQYGEVVRIGHNQVSVADPAELRRILASHEFRKGAHYEQGVMMSPSTFSCIDPELNKKRRRQLGPAYALSALRGLEATIVEHGAQALMAAWDERIRAALEAGDGARAEVNYFHGFHGVAVDVIGVLGFGRSFGLTQGADAGIVDAMRKHVTLVALSARVPVVGTRRWLFPRLHAARDRVVGVARGAIGLRRQEMAARGEKQRRDILQRLIDARDPETGEALHGPALTIEVLLMMIAGTDTTSNTMTYTLMHLLHHPAVLARLQRDIRQAFPDASAAIRYDEARERVPLLTAVILEAMRLHPAVNGYQPRTVPAGGAVLRGRYAVPARTDICVAIGAANRNARVWERPLQFDPGRFLGPDGEARRKDMLSFSSGVRMCLGRNLAMIELHTVLANVLRRYALALPAAAPYGPHRPSTRPGAAGQPEHIPGSSFITFGPDCPHQNCVVEISLAG
ncbi:hypothetical protein H4R18_000892 [Coemansia javaensis]|uniref:Cytochrome P450 n=1 Tax=Coemansia javaensis TaxID=2761396 RepID=A0A9W8HMB4_9FUNG|nr:hypothetical protein H4R18_000892 [Coemansia javaensis]